MKWISVKDELPVDDQTVLITHTKIDKMIHTAYYEEETDSFFSLNSFHALPIEITHWMELPKPPKDQERKPKTWFSKEEWQRIMDWLNE